MDSQLVTLAFLFVSRLVLARSLKYAFCGRIPLDAVFLVTYLPTRRLSLHLHCAHTTSISLCHCVHPPLCYCVSRPPPAPLLRRLIVSLFPPGRAQN